ncbi:MAG TPA: hypothetical protein VJS37_03355 [Terriglobales bacterium]|nr:hypothetical protein [Terriglobales bacterium]
MSTSLALRQEEMRRRYEPMAERALKKRGPANRGKVELLLSPVKRKHFSEACQIGYHYLQCPDLSCDCTCQVADGEYKGEVKQ